MVGDAIGSRVTSEFSHEGASVFLSGRRLNPIKKIVKEIRASNGKADAAEVDAFDEKGVGPLAGYESVIGYVVDRLSGGCFI